ncbi:hypothetical protein [Luteolibacter sp. AS25]|uniref:hypothetical protein n=1 Tax=Luteolibacter sp. AS25 TaxID=3135776 RepID=UPI00398A67AF
MTTTECAIIGAVLTGFLAAFSLIRLLARPLHLSPEFTRKSIHVIMGLTCATFPWIFHRPLPVWILALIATLPILGLRTIPFLKKHFGKVLHGISRPSYGEILFAPAVATVFQLAGGDVLLFVIPILILTLADAAAALAGTHWGKLHYISGKGKKSIEGSIGFLLVAFACISIPLLLSGTINTPNALWIAIILATLAMMTEGFSDRGLDNILLPVGCFFILQRLLPLENQALGTRFLVLILLLALVLTAFRSSLLSGAALLGSAMLGYGCAVLADWRFAIPPSIVFVSRLITLRAGNRQKPPGIDAVISHAIACLPWVLAVSFHHISPDLGLAGISTSMAIQLVILYLSDGPSRFWNRLTSSQTWFVRGTISLTASLPILLFRNLL